MSALTSSQTNFTDFSCFCSLFIVCLKIKLTWEYLVIKPWWRSCLECWTRYFESRGFDSRPRAFRQQPWASCSHTCASVTKQYNLVPVKGRWCPAAGKVTVGLASQWPCVTDFSGLSTCGLTACEREMSCTLPALLTGHGTLYLLPNQVVTLTRVTNERVV